MQATSHHHIRGLLATEVFGVSGMVIGIALAVVIVLSRLG